MPTVSANGISIAYDTWGDNDASTVLLLPGVGRQLVEWEPELIEGLVAGGYRVLAIDQRDTGLSTHFRDAGKAPLAQLRRRRYPGGNTQTAGIAPELPYGLDDLAGDAVGVLDSLGIDAAHVVGVSLGGAVAQQMAVHDPHRLRSLTSLMSSTGNPDVGQPDAVGNRALFRSPPPEAKAAIDAIVEARRLISTSDGFDEDFERRRVSQAVHRSFDPAGTGRQLAALWAAGDRTEQLATIEVPTLVIHGSADRLVDVSGGEATAETIPDARLVVLEGMGHDLAKPFLRRIVDELLEHFRTAES